MGILSYRGVAVAALMVSSLGPLAAQSPDGRTGTLVVLNKSVATATFIDVASGGPWRPCRRGRSRTSWP